MLLWTCDIYEEYGASTSAWGKWGFHRQHERIHLTNEDWDCTTKTGISVTRYYKKNLRHQNWEVQQPKCWSFGSCPTGAGTQPWKLGYNWLTTSREGCKQHVATRRKRLRFHHFKKWCTVLHRHELRNCTSSANMINHDGQLGDWVFDGLNSDGTINNSGHNP